MKCTHLIESRPGDGTCFRSPLYLRHGGLESAQESGPFTMEPYEAQKMDCKETAHELADACNLLYPLSNGAHWAPVEHAFH